MALESGTYINDLVITNPTGSDNRRQGDDHLRLIKSILKSTFPNLDSAVTPTPAQLNVLTSLLSTAAELNLLDGSQAGVIVNSKGVIYGAAGEVNATSLEVGGIAITATPGELNILDGATLTTAELNYLAGITSSVQTQLDAITTNNFSADFSSTGQAIVSGVRTTVPHSLGAAPKLIHTVIQCTSADRGYSVGDRVHIIPTDSQIGISADATNIYAIYDNDGTVFKLGNKLTGGGIDWIDESKWDMYFYAWV